MWRHWTKKGKEVKFCSTAEQISKWNIFHRNANIFASRLERNMTLK